MIKYLYVEDYSDYVFYTKSQINELLAVHKCITDKEKKQWLINNGYTQYNIGDRIQESCKEYPIAGRIFESQSEKIRYFSERIRNTPATVDVIFEYNCGSDHYVDRILFNVFAKDELYVCTLKINYNPIYTSEENVDIEYVSGSISGCMFACLVEFMNSNHHGKDIVWDTITQNV